MTVTPESRDAHLEGEAEVELTARETVDIMYGPRTVYERMVAIIEELPAIGKTQRNREQGFMFRGHDDVMNALNPLLAKHGVFVVPDVVERETNTRTTSRGSTMYEVNLHVRFTFYGAGGDSFQASGWGEGTDMGDKATNKAMTGAFKYVVAQAFALATAETSDADATSPEETTTGEQRGGRQQRGSGRAKAETFDPSRNLLPEAIEVKNADDANSIRQGQRDLDPNQDWPAIEEYLATSVFGKGLNDLTRAETGAYWKRLANAVAKAWEAGGDLVSHEEVAAAYEWAFGVKLALAAPEAPEHATPEDANQDAVEQAADEETAA